MYRRHLGAGARRVHRLAAAVDQVLVERVLHVGRGIGDAEQPRGVGLVVGEQELGRRAVRRGSGDEPIATEARVVGENAAVDIDRQVRFPPVALVGRAPAPGVAKPQRRQQRERGPLGATVGDGDADREIVRRRLAVFDLDVEVAVLGEHPGVRELVFRLELPAAPILLDERRVRELGLRVLVERAQVRVGGCRVEVVVELLHVLAVVALRAGQPEQALLEDRIATVPERDREAQAALAIGDAEQAVFPPPVHAAARVVVREVGPALAVGGVVLAHRPPLAFREIRSPALPVAVALDVLVEALALDAREARDLVGGAGHVDPFGHREPPRSTRESRTALSARSPARAHARRDRGASCPRRSRTDPRRAAPGRAR
jgi:hypothetical protein